MMSGTLRVSVLWPRSGGLWPVTSWPRELIHSSFFLYFFLFTTRPINWCPSDQAGGDRKCKKKETFDPFTRPHILKEIKEKERMRPCVGPRFMSGTLRVTGLWPRSGERSSIISWSREPFHSSYFLYNILYIY